MTITSTSNSEIKRIRGLHQRKDRNETGLYLVEGTRLVGTALECGAEIERIVFCRPQVKGYGERILREAERRGVPCLEVTNQVLTSITADHAYQGIVAVVRQRWTSLKDIVPAGELCWLAVNAVQCPSNLGTMLRASDAVGGAGVILIGSATDPFCTAAVRSSVGAIFSQRIVRADLEDLAGWARLHGYTVIGTSPYSSEGYRSMVYPTRTVLFMGNERSGLTEVQQASCDLMVSIPMVGRVDSHNVAVAASIVMYEILDQRLRDVTAGRQCECSSDTHSSSGG